MSPPGDPFATTSAIDEPQPEAQPAPAPAPAVSDSPNAIEIESFRQAVWCSGPMCAEGADACNRLRGAAPGPTSDCALSMNWCFGIDAPAASDPAMSQVACYASRPACDSERVLRSQASQNGNGPAPITGCDSIPFQPSPEAIAASAPATVRDSIAYLRRLTNRFCACTDKACGDAVSGLLAATPPKPTAKPTHEEYTAGQAAVAEYKQCLQRLGYAP